MGRTEGGVGRQLEAGSGENTAWVQPLLDPAGAAGNFALRAEYLQQLRAAACAQTPVAGRQCQMGWFLSCILRVLLLAFKHFGCDSFAVNFV